MRVCATMLLSEKKKKTGIGHNATFMNFREIVPRISIDFFLTKILCERIMKFTSFIRELLLSLIHQDIKFRGEWIN